MRFPYLYDPIECGKPRNAWANDRVLGLAGEIFRAFQAKDIVVPARVAAANDIYRLLVTLDPRKTAARLQLAVTALEAFYIGQDRMYLWGKPAKAAIRHFVGCGVEESLFERLHCFRNAAVHQGGTPWFGPNGDGAQATRICTETENLLRRTMFTAVLNLPDVVKKIGGGLLDCAPQSRLDAPPLA